MKTIKVGDKILTKDDVTWFVTGVTRELVDVRREIEGCLLIRQVRPIGEERKEFGEWECDWWSENRE